MLLPASDWGNQIVTGLLVGHNQDGTHIASLPLTTPKITTSINDANGNEVIKTPATASAVNEVTVTNAATGNAPQISATGDDTNVNLKLAGKGNSGVLLQLALQAITTNTYPSGLKVQHGWSYINVGGGNGSTTSITFPDAFSSAPVVLGSILGAKDSANPTAITDFSIPFDRTTVPLEIGNIGTTGFTAGIYTNATGTSFTAGRRMGFSWIAIGPA